MLGHLGGVRVVRAHGEPGHGEQAEEDHEHGPGAEQMVDTGAEESEHDRGEGELERTRERRPEAVPQPLPIAFVCIHGSLRLRLRSAFMVRSGFAFAHWRFPRARIASCS